MEYMQNSGGKMSEPATWKTKKAGTLRKAGYGNETWMQLDRHHVEWQALI
jgi:hypothetical protein